MPQDFKTFDTHTTLETDLCIIGGGAAGITLAREFINTGTRVVLLESGSTDYEDDTQALYHGEQASKKRARSIEDGIHYGVTLHDSRLRYFGGTTNHWGGWCAPLTPMDFEKRDWIPHSGWPISYKEILPYYERAKKTCEIGKGSFDKSLWDGQKETPYAFDENKIVSRFFRFSPPTRFGERYGKELDGAQNINVILNANVTKLKLNDSMVAIEAVDIKSLNGNSGTVKAKQFVLACGGIENARILLLSNDKIKAGVGNQNDLVGRYFMDHMYDMVGSIMTPDKPTKLQNLFEQFTPSDNQEIPVQAALCPSDEVQQSKKIMNIGLILSGDWRKPSPGVGALYRLREAQILDKETPNLSDELFEVLTDLDDALPEATRILRGKRPKHLPRWTGFCEQSPNPLSRVMLSDQKDALGLNRVLLDWRLTQLDRHTFKEMAKTIAAEFGRLGIGRIQIASWLEESAIDFLSGDFSRRLESGRHQSGTTRMSDDSQKGVVDKNCQVHGVKNLHIAGSSVFPTAGYANPTLTIVALTHRLADHLRGQMSEHA